MLVLHTCVGVCPALNISQPLEDPITSFFFSHFQGNVQGKYQLHPEVEGNKDYLQAPLWGGSPVELPIPPAKNGKLLSFLENFNSMKQYKVACASS